MNLKYDVEVISFEEIQELPESWSTEDFKEILSRADFDNADEIDENELKEYVIMALQEFDADEAAEIILEYKLGDQLSRGQIQNIAHEMQDDKIWEEYTDIGLHRKLYDCSVLLEGAFPNSFPDTDAVKCVIKVSTNSNESELSMDKAQLMRLLAKGMDTHAVVNRLFDDQVNGKPFPEAEGIVWQYDMTTTAKTSTITIYSSNYWLHGMDDVQEYSCQLIVG